MPAIFISHSSLDQKAADEIKAVLAGMGFDRVFLDFDKLTGIGAGENWEKRLYEELTRCHAVVLILTPNWLASKWCFAELQQARALGKMILPVVFGPPGESYVLPEIQAVDVIEWKREGWARLERRLNAITHELARGFRLEPGRPPYPGIHAFEAEDAAIYFGRDDETRAVIEKLDARRTQGGVRFLLVIGASGAGKSSLLKAGVLPQLERRRSHWLLLPVMRPEKAPLEAFTKTLAQHLGRENDWRALYEDLRDPNAARRIAQIIQDLRVGERRVATIVLPIDQFEEVFTVAEPGERASLLTLLATILDPVLGLPLMVIATGRADVLQGVLETSALAPLMDTTPLLPMPLNRIPQLVRGPAAVASLVVEPGLAERIMRDVENPEALPLLAYMLHLLNERSPDKRLTHDAYTALGDANLNPVQNAVRLGADQAIAILKPAEQEMAALRDAFIPHLVRLRLDDKRHVRQPAPLAALPREAERLIHALIEARLLTSRTSDQGLPMVEVVHEALFSAWPTLKGWLDDEQDFLADIERLKGAQETWMQAADAQKPQALLRGLLLSRARDWLIKYSQRFGNPGMEPLRAFIADSAAADDTERARSQRLRRRVFQGMAAAILVLAAAAAFAGWQYFETDQARREAETQRGIAQRQTDLALQREEEAQRERQESEKQRDLAQGNFGIAKRAADDVVFVLAQGLRNVAGMRLEYIHKILGAAQGLLDQLARAAPDDLDLQRSRSSMFNGFVDTYLPLGDVTRAGTAADESLAIMRKLAASDPGNSGWQRDLGISLHRVGDVRLAAGERGGALAVFEEYLAIARKLAASDPGNAEWQRDVGLSLNRVGTVKLAAGDRAGALAAYEEHLAIARKLVAGPGNAQWQRDIALSLDFIGSVRLAAGDRAGALAAYEELLAIARKLAAADPGNVEWQRALGIGVCKIGDVRFAAGDHAGALTACQESLAIARKLAAADPGNAQWQRDVAVSLNKVGNVRLATGDRAGSLAVYEDFLAIVRNLAASDPGNAGWQRDLGIGLNNIGDLRLAAGDPAGALAACEESLAIARKLAASDPGNAEWQRDAEVSLDKIGNVRLAAGDHAGARAAYEELLAIARKLATADSGNAKWQADLFMGLYKVGIVSDPIRARESLTEALSIAETLTREQKLPASQEGWPQMIRGELAKLPPDRAKSR
jgi:tetratricopeptide (TPR) repeat protein